MLSTRLLLHQPTPIRVGAIAALARMKSREYPFSAIENDTRKYVDMIREDEKYNIKQIFSLLLNKIKNQLSSFFIGIVTGVIGSLIVWWIQRLIE